MGKLGQTLAQYWTLIQRTLFPRLEEELDPITEKQQQLITILELVRIEQFIPDRQGCEGRPLKTRSQIARSFVAKMVYNMERSIGLATNSTWIQEMAVCRPKQDHLDWNILLFGISDIRKRFITPVLKPK